MTKFKEIPCKASRIKPIKYIHSTDNRLKIIILIFPIGNLKSDHTLNKYSKHRVSSYKNITPEALLH